MIMTSEWALIMDEVDKLNTMIVSSEIVKTYSKVKQSVYDDLALVNEINDFTKMKDQYEDVQRFGRYHPDYDKVMKDVRVKKRTLDLDNRVAELKLAENDVQDLLDEIALLIGKTVSESVKVPVSNPFFASDSSCGSSCGTGGSCSCSA